MERIYIHGQTYEFPEADFGDLSVLVAIDRAAELSRKCSETPFEGFEEQISAIRTCAEGMMAELDTVLGAGASARMFGSRINPGELAEVFRQLLEGFREACGWDSDELEEA